MPINIAHETAVAAWERVRTRTASAGAWATVAGAFGFSMFWGSRSFSIQDNNEAIYAEVAREMLARHDWVVPHLDGVPYLDKPPVLYWLEALLMLVFGQHDWVVRLGPVLCFAATLVAVVRIGRLLRAESAGQKAALLLCSAIGVVGMSRSLLFDVPLMAVLSWSFACFLQWRFTGSRVMLRWVYALIGVGVMTKGLVAVAIGGGSMAVATFLQRRSVRDVAGLADGRGFTLFLAVVLPWHLLAAAHEPGFAAYYVVNEHVRRFLGTREPHDFYRGPLYYYLVRLPLYLGVWLFAVPVLVRRRSKRAITATSPLREGRRLLGTAVLMTAVFFSLSGGKANYYLLSIMPALALCLVLEWPDDGARDLRPLVCAIGIGLLGAGFALAPELCAHQAKIAVLLVGQEPSLTATALTLVALAVVAAALARQRRHHASFLTVAAAGLAMMLPLPALLQRADVTLSERRVAAFLRQRGEEEPVMLYRDYENLSSFVYYHGTPVPVVDSTSNELYYAAHQPRKDPMFVDDDEIARLVQEQRVWLVATPQRADEALARFRPLGCRVVKRFPRAVVILVGNRPSSSLALVATNDGGKL